MKDKGVVSSTKNVQIVLTTPGGPNCRLYLVQVLITSICQ
jgi:hypothetical protein